MQYEFILAKTEKGLFYERPSEGPAVSVVTVMDAVEMLGKSRRQVYRYLEDGHLAGVGKVLGDWLLRRDSVERLARFGTRGLRVPATMQPLFPDRKVEELAFERDRQLLLERFLEEGSMKQLRWLVERVGWDAVVVFVRERGGEVLSERAQRLWSQLLSRGPEALQDL